MFEYLVPEERLGELLTEEQWDDLHKDIKSDETETFIYNENEMLIRGFKLNPEGGTYHGQLYAPGFKISSISITYNNYVDFARQYIDGYISTFGGDK
jgi:hypothetical protein